MTIFTAFVAGSAGGALLAVKYASWSLLPVVLLLLGGAIYAAVSGRSVVVVATSPRGSDPELPRHEG